MTLTREESARYRSLVLRLHRLKARNPNHPDIEQLEAQIWVWVDKIISEGEDG